MGQSKTTHTGSISRLCLFKINYEYINSCYIIPNNIDVTTNKDILRQKLCIYNRWTVKYCKSNFIPTTFSFANFRKFTLLNLWHCNLHVDFSEKGNLCMLPEMYSISLTILLNYEITKARKLWNKFLANITAFYRMCINAWPSQSDR